MGCFSPPGQAGNAIEEKRIIGRQSRHSNLLSDHDSLRNHIVSPKDIEDQLAPSSSNVDDTY